MSGAAAVDRHVAHRHRRVEARPEAARGDRSRRPRPPRSAKSAVPSRIGARPSGRRPTRRRVAPRAIWSRMTASPGKPPARAPPRAAGGLDRPFERRLDRRRRAVDVVAVEAEPGLEAQRVAGAEADGQDLRVGEQGLGDVDRVLGPERDLEAVLAGIAGARDDRLDAAGLERAHVHEAHRPRRRGNARASTAAAFGPCRARRARSSISTVQVAASAASRRARSSALQAALTTRSRWSPRFATIRSSRMPPSSSVKSA